MRNPTRHFLNMLKPTEDENWYTGPIVTEDGITHTAENQKANVLNEFFSSVFTQEDTGPLPEFVDRAYDAIFKKISPKIRGHTK